ncbi:MAG: antibiotic biosynthesis monooxygenase family protein [Hyphomonas sp.]
MIAKTPEAPYWAVIFTAVFSGREEAEYGETAARMVALAEESPGFLGYESAQGEGGLEITVSYWESEEAIRAWKRNTEHLAAQKRGREAFYSAYTIRVAKVERAYGF